MYQLFLSSLLILLCTTQALAQDCSDKLFQNLNWRQAILSSETPVAAPSTNLTADQAKEDFIWFFYFLKCGYSAFPYFQSQGLDYDAYVQKSLATIVAQNSWSTADFSKLITDLPNNLTPDGHFTVWYHTLLGKEVLLNDYSSFRAKAFVATDTAGDLLLKSGTCKLSSSTKLLLDQTSLQNKSKVKVNILLSPTELSNVVCTDSIGTDQIVALKKFESTPSSLPLFYEQELTKDAYYIRAGTFNPSAPAVNQQFINSAKQARTYKKLVLDVRGNGGGDPAVFLQWLDEMELGPIQVNSTPGSAVDSAATIITFYNTTKQILGQVRKSGNASMIAQYENQLKEYDDILKEIEKNNLWTDRSDISEAGSPIDLKGSTFKGEIALIVDERCGSACEMLIYYAEQIPNFKIYGTNTAGVNSFGNPARAVLPNSKIHIHIPNWAMSLGKGTTYAERYGLTPQVWVEGQLLQQVMLDFL